MTLTTENMEKEGKQFIQKLSLVGMFPTPVTRQREEKDIVPHKV